jgi:hypothetical protein
MRCGPATFAVLALLVGLPPAAAEERSVPKLRCEAYPSDQPLRVCTQLDESAFSRLGQRTTWRIVIDSGGKPVQVRLHNSSPEVLRLKGGNDQTVHMGCPRHKEVLRTVVSVGPGVPHLAARPRNPSPEQESSTIAAELAPLLARIEAEFIERRDKLSQTPDYSAEAVSELLDTTEKELLDALSYRELAALRDYVRAKFREARAMLEDVHAFRPSSSNPVFASFAISAVTIPTAIKASFNQGTIRKESVIKAKDWVHQLIRQLRGFADQDNFLTSLCVTSKPKQGAQFRMRPQSFNQWMNKSTDGRFPVVFRGLYIFSMEKRGFTEQTCLDPEGKGCTPIDLVNQSDLTFICDFDKNFCEPSEVRCEQ